MKDKEKVIYSLLLTRHTVLLNLLSARHETKLWAQMNDELATVDWLLYSFENQKIKLVEVKE